LGEDAACDFSQNRSPWDGQEDIMLTIVMSGGANFGAMQAGALQVLIESGLQPKMAVGTSAGALNSIYLASDPSPEGMQRLLDAWRSIGPKEVGMPKILTVVRRLLTGQAGLIPSEPLANFLNGHFPPGVTTFGQLTLLHGIQAYTVAACLETAKTVVFGDNDDDGLIDGAMSSTAVPPFYPPWKVGGYRYLDGGITEKLPLLPAIERGATQIIALDIYSAMGSLEMAKSMITLTGYSLSIMTENQAEREIAAAKATGVALRVIKLFPPADIDFWDYDAVERLIEAGKQQAREAIEKEPIRLAPQLPMRVRKSVASLIKRVFG
jgi:predicted acylesterase/phospholipase RssA